MTRNLEGTVQLDGLIEGHLPPDDEAIESRLREWVDFARQSHLRFSLEVDGGSFSLLPDTGAVPSDRLGPDPAETIRQTLDALLQAFPAAHRSGVFSTLRASEFQPGTEIQTLFAIGPDGRAQTRQRTVDAETTPPAEPLTLAGRIKAVMIGLAIAAVVIAISAIWVPYGRLVSEAIHRVQPVDTARIELELGHFAPYFNVGEMSTRTADGRLLLVIPIERTEVFPTDDAALQAAWIEAGNDLHRQLTIESLARGRVAIDQFDQEGEFLGRSLIRIAALRSKAKAELELPISRKYRPSRVVFGY